MSEERDKFEREYCLKPIECQECGGTRVVPRERPFRGEDFKPCKCAKQPPSDKQREGGEVWKCGRIS